jgi:hypothetical protein
MSIRSIAAVTACGLAACLSAGRGPAETATDTIDFGELLLRIQHGENYASNIPIPSTIRDERDWVAIFTKAHEQSLKAGAEVGIAGYYIDRGNISIFHLIPPIVGKEYSVSIEKLRDAVLTDSRNPNARSIIIAHTHPSVSTFSTGDIAAAAQNKAAVVVINSRYMEMIVPSAPIPPTQYYLGYYLGGSAWSDRAQCNALAAGATTPAAQEPFYYARQQDMIGSFRLTHYRYDAARKVWARLPPPAKLELTAFVTAYRTALPDATRLTINQLGVDEAARRIAAGTLGAAVAGNMQLKMIDFLTAAIKSPDTYEGARRAPRIEDHRSYFRGVSGRRKQALFGQCDHRLDPQ